MLYGVIKRLLTGEYADFDDTVLIESPFRETNQTGALLRFVQLGLTGKAFIIASEYKYKQAPSNRILAVYSSVTEIISFYPWESLKLSVVKRCDKQYIKASFSNNTVRYFELWDMPKKQDRQPTLPLRKQEPQTEATSNGHLQNGHSQLQKGSTDNPPPPPPMPSANGLNGNHKIENGNHQTSNTLKPAQATSLISNIRKNATLTRTPTPDYNNKVEPLPQMTNGKEEKAEMESLESYKLKNPSSVQPKPPSHYFVKAPNGTATMKKHARPVSVTIGEYAYGGGSRPPPTKLEFLNGDKTDGLRDKDDEVSISNRLQSELAMTLSRSNLRKKTEALADTSR